MYRGSAARVRASDIPKPRSLSLADEEGTTIAVVASELELARFAVAIADVAAGAELVVEIDGAPRELRRQEGPALIR